MKGNGNAQGDMSPKVNDYQTPTSAFPESGFSKTTEYISRQDAQRNKAASDIRKQAYKGRYS
jgi:hypothetical protein